MRKAAILVALLALNCATTQPPNLPTTGEFTTPDGVRVHYRIVGKGPHTVLVPLVFWNVPRFERAPASLRFVFYDPRGRGRSAAVAASDASVTHDLTDLEAVRRHVGAEKVSLIGTSMYGALVARYAMLHPERVRKLVMVGAAAMYSDAPKADQAEQGKRIDVQKLVALNARQASMPPEQYCSEWWNVMAPLYVGRTENAAMLERLCDLPNEQPAKLFPHLGAVLGSLGTYDWREEAKKISAPALVIHLVVPIAIAREWDALLPNDELWVLENGGHVPWYEDADVLFPRIFEFLTGE